MDITKSEPVKAEPSSPVRQRRDSTSPSKSRRSSQNASSMKEEPMSDDDAPLVSVVCALVLTFEHTNTTLSLHLLLSVKLITAFLISFFEP